MTSRTLRRNRWTCIQQTPRLLAARKGAVMIRQMPSPTHAGKADSRGLTSGIKADAVEFQGSRNLLFGHEMPAALSCRACLEFLLMRTAPEATHTYGSR